MAVARSIWITLVIFAVASGYAGETAGDILKQTGVQGGLIVHLGCGDGQLTAALRANDSYLVHGLDRDASNVAATRKVLREKGLYGKVTATRLTSACLPYIDNTVNLLVAQDLGEIPMDEVKRVLAPNGVFYAPDQKSKKIKNQKYTKPWPREIDEWPQYLHDASNNAVAHDTVIGDPQHLQWHGGPKWSRHHDHLSSISAMVSAAGRVFYIIDEGPRSLVILPPVWKLVARDAFNGTVLWKRDIGEWTDALWPLKSGPANLPRRLVAKGNEVYAPLGFNVPVSALDATTGKTLRTYEKTEGVEELLLIDDMLLAVVNEVHLSARDEVEKVNVSKGAKFFTDTRVTKYPKGQKLWYQVQSPQWLESKRAVMAFKADTGGFLWKKDSRIVPVTLAADSERVYFHDGDKVVALNRKNGKDAWQGEKVPIRRIESWFAPTLVVHKNTVLFAGGEEVPHSSLGWRGGNGTDALTAFDAKTGKKIWTGKHPFCGYQSPEDLMVIDDLVWAADIAKGQGDGVFKGCALRTGKMEKQLKPTLKAYWFHHRCHRAKATDQYFLTSRTGIELIDTKTGEWTINHWVRGGCLYGIMPANGLIYTPPHPCSCYGQAKLSGFNALAAPSPTRKVEPAPKEARLEKGPAYDQIPNPQSSIRNSDDWATYRGSPARDGYTAERIPTTLKQGSSVAVGAGARMTPPVTAEGLLIAAAIDEHAVRAFDAASGEKKWEFIAGGRVDSPPTIHDGRVLFGSADGYVYCLRLNDGQLCWRFLAAPVDRRMVCCGQVESVWPVHGSILVEKNVAWFVAGRSFFLDGGVRLYALDPKTGDVVAENLLNDRDPKTGKDLQSRIKVLSMPVALPDILSSNGEHLFMRSQAFDLKGKREDRPIDHLFAPFSWLDQTGFHRTYWIYGNSYNGTIGGYTSGLKGIGARIMVHDKSRVYGFGRKPKYFRWASAYEYQLFAVDLKGAASAGPKAAPKKKGKGKGKRGGEGRKTAWVTDLPFLVRAMVLSDKTLFLAGVPSALTETDALERLESDEIKDKIKEHDAALKGEKGGVLWAISAEDGKKIAEYPLAVAPLFDGMIAANGKLYIAARNGEVLTFEGK